MKTTLRWLLVVGTMAIPAFALWADNNPTTGAKAADQDCCPCCCDSSCPRR